MHAGQDIEEGALLGTLKDFFGNTITAFLSPCTGVVLDFIAAPPIKEGDTAVNLGGIIARPPAATKE